MSYSISQQVELNESKFLSEQVNWDQEPTEEEIIEKAEELGIDDFAMARDALLKELDPEWKPYINRYGKVFYINLEEKKGYVDHPIDMFYKIDYAVKTKKKIPSFQEYSLDQISEDPKIIYKEISSFQMNQDLKIVYEESQEESIKRNTLRSEPQEDFIVQSSDFNLEYEHLARILRDQMQKEIKQELKQYRQQQEQFYIINEKCHEERVDNMKKQRMRIVEEQFTKEWEANNKDRFLKSIQATKNEFQSKIVKYEQFLDREQKILEQIHSLSDVKMNYSMLYKEKIVNQKEKERDKTLRGVYNNYSKNIMSAIYESKKEFQSSVKQFTNSRRNYQDLFNSNLKELNRQQQIPRKRKHSIFHSQLAKEKEKTKNQTIKEELKCDQKVWTQRYDDYSQHFDSKVRPSMSLRLFKRIL